VNDDLIKRLRDKQNWITPSTFLILEVADALEAAHQRELQREVAATRRFDTLQQRIADLMQELAAQPIDCCQQWDTCSRPCRAGGRIEGLREALEAVRQLEAGCKCTLIEDCPHRGLGDAALAIQALISTAQH
jgi:hypothetical protein